MKTLIIESDYGRTPTEIEQMKDMYKRQGVEVIVLHPKNKLRAIIDDTTGETTVAPEPIKMGTLVKASNEKESHSAELLSAFMSGLAIGLAILNILLGCKLI